MDRSGAVSVSRGQSPTRDLSRGGFKSNPKRERGLFHAGFPDALAHASGYFSGFETTSGNGDKFRAMKRAVTFSATAPESRARLSRRRTAFRKVPGTG